ncbi:hypothetical protein PQX77_011443, partial [Marasmius sp. AFHP31]
ISTIMVLVATAHISISFHRALLAFGPGRDADNSPQILLTRFTDWHRITKDVLFVFQELLGSSTAVYLTWILWSQDWRIIACPLVLLVGEAVAGFGACGTYPKITSKTNVARYGLEAWIKTHSGILVVVNLATTSLMVFRIWRTHRTSSKYLMFPSRLAPILKILIESAMLQLVAELLLFIFVAVGSDARYILLDAITPIIGITFNAITIRVKLHSFKEGANFAGGSPPTIGSLPMRRIPAELNIPHINSRAAASDVELQMSPSTLVEEIVDRDSHGKVLSQTTP